MHSALAPSPTRGRLLRHPRGSFQLPPPVVLDHGNARDVHVHDRNYSQNRSQTSPRRRIHQISWVCGRYNILKSQSMSPTKRIQRRKEIRTLRFLLARSFVIYYTFVPNDSLTSSPWSPAEAKCAYGGLSCGDFIF